MCAHVVYSVRAVAHVTVGKSATARDARGVPTYSARVRGGGRRKEEEEEEENESGVGWTGVVGKPHAAVGA